MDASRLRHSVGRYPAESAARDAGGSHTMVNPAAWMSGALAATMFHQAHRWEFQ
jgi:hypothetical protein